MLAIEPCTIQHLETLLISPDVFRKAFGLSLADDYDIMPRELQQSLFRLKHGAVLPRWGSHLLVLEDERVVVGMAGYGGNPDEEATVEIDCSIAPSYRGRGLGTTTVRALVQRAFGSGEVRCVRVHSPSRAGTASRPLRALGMAPTDEVSGADGERLWRWELRLDPALAARAAG